MNIAILGATGTFGSALAKSLINDTDYNLALISRHADEHYQSGDKVTVINADATNQKQLGNALKDADIVYCAVSGEQLPLVAENIVNVMPTLNISRLLFMGAVGIYNEIPADIDDDDNLDNEPHKCLIEKQLILSRQAI